MFASLKTIDSAFQQVKTLALLFIVAVLVLAGTIAYFAFQTTNAAANRIYVLEGGQLLTAGARDARANRPVEARSHVTRFHELFFTLDRRFKPVDPVLETVVGPQIEMGSQLAVAILIPSNDRRIRWSRGRGLLPSPDRLRQRYRGKHNEGWGAELHGYFMPPVSRPSN